MILAWLAAAFLLGDVLGAWLVWAPLPLIIVASVMILIAAGVRHLPWRAVPLAIAALTLGLARAPHPLQHPAADQLSYYEGRYVQVQGVVAEEPDVRDSAALYVVDARQLTIGPRTRPVRGRMQIRAPRSIQLDYGETVAVTGRLVRPSNGPLVPYRDILAQRGIASTMRYPRVMDLGPSVPGPLSWIVPLRQRFEAGIDAWLPEPEAALLIAITLGAHSAALGDLTAALIATGLIHIIAISGIKVAMVAGTLYELARLSRRRLLALVASLAGLSLYVLLTGATVSGERSGAMWVLVFIAAYLGRGTLAIVSLSVVAALMVAVDPALPTNIGFQLSTLGTFAIVTFTHPLTRVFRYLPSPVRAAFCTTLAAQIGTLPVVIVGFHVISLSGVMANAVVLPLLPLLIALGFLLGVTAPLSIIAGPTAAMSYALTHLVVQLAGLLGRLPADILSSTVSPLFTVLYYVLLTIIAIFVLRRLNWAPVGSWASRGHELAIALTAGCLILTGTVVRAQPVAGDRLRWLGSGESLLLQSGHTSALIDGSPHPFDLLERLGEALPFGTHTIDLVVLTDPRAGNLMGLREILKHYRVLEVLDVGVEYPSGTYAAWRSDLRARHIRAYALRPGVAARLGDFRLTVVAPDGLSSRPQDSSGIVRLQIGRRSILLAGVASQRQQLETTFHRPVHANTLVLESSDGASIPFVRAVRPRAIFSTPSTPGATPLRDGSTLDICCSR